MAHNRQSARKIDRVVDWNTEAGVVAPQTAPSPDAGSAAMVSGEEHLMVRNGVRCAGAHIIVDLYGGERLDDLAHVEDTLVRCVEASGATLLHVHLHHFDDNSGVSGVAVLAESHISIHSWPEHGYAALDIFMCGDTQPEACVGVLKEAFRPDRVVVDEFLRGRGL